MRNGLATGVLNVQNGLLFFGVKWDNKMSFVIFSLVIFLKDSGFLTQDFKRLVSSCGFSRGIFLEQDFLLQISGVGSDGKLSCVRKQSNKSKKGLVGSDGLEMCESVSNVNNKQIKRKF